MKIIQEFKTFISRGNVLDMAVGVIIGGAFTAIVNSLVADVINPILGIITGGLDFSALSITFNIGAGEAKLNYGSFISAIINFLLVAMALFLLVKAINKFRLGKKEAPPAAPPEPTTKICPFCRSEIALEATRCPHCTSQLEAEQEPA